jgi:hypothetical protein
MTLSAIGRSPSSMAGRMPAYIASFATIPLWVLGYPNQALERGNQAVALTQGLSHPHSLAFTRNFVGPVHQFRREVRAAQENAESVIALSAEHGYTDRFGYATLVRGWAMAEEGRDEERIAQIREALAALAQQGRKRGHILFAHWRRPALRPVASTTG